MLCPFSLFLVFFSRMIYYRTDVCSAPILFRSLRVFVATVSAVVAQQQQRLGGQLVASASATRVACCAFFYFFSEQQQ
jgi:hypothetical protein